MLPQLKGPQPWAVILCRFNDVPEPAFPRSYFENFFTESGRGSGNLFDYWREVSNGNIDFRGSIVRGWYTMRYSYIRDGRDPFRNGSFPRGAWIAEAKRLATENGVDLSHYQHVVAVINANADDSASGADYAVGVGGTWGQSDWRWCHKCNGLFYKGNGTNGVCPVDHNSHDYNGSSSYALALNSSTFPGENNWKWCSKCQGLAFGTGAPGNCPANGVHDHTGGGNYTLATTDLNLPFPQKDWKKCRKCKGLFFAGEGSPSLCAGGGYHDFTGSLNYSLLSNWSSLNVTFAAHESGHGLGYNHSWSANPDVEYGDQWDIMSAMAVKAFNGLNSEPSGPGINAPTLYNSGWLPDTRVWSHRSSSDNSTIQLRALSRSTLAGYLMARIIKPDKIYTVEFRVKDKWDQGLDRPGIFIHELRSNFSVGQQNWRHCNNCRTLFYAGNSVCPAGGVHDYTGSSNYSLINNIPTAPGQHNWRFCKKCSSLAFAGNSSPGTCAAGGVHNFTASGDYSLAHVAGGLGQHNWKWCNKCQSLTYAGNASQGACPAGGVHDHTGSWDYNLLSDQSGSTYQSNWRHCRKCEGLAFNHYGPCPSGNQHDPVNSLDYSLISDVPGTLGQHNWKWCKKCRALAFASNGATGVCKAGGRHDFSGSGDYRVIVNDANAKGQNNWFYCSKCEQLFSGIDSNIGACSAGGGHDKTRSGMYTVQHFMDSSSYLINSPTGDWQPGQEFEDTSRGIRIRIVSFDSVERATIAISG